MIIKYIRSIKLKIIIGNLLSLISGFLLSSKVIKTVDINLLSYTVLGMFFLLISNCLLNNYIDRDIDMIMNRTKNRLPMNNSKILSLLILLISIILAILGLSILFITNNLLVFILSIFATIIYVIFYSLYLKRRSSHSILIGSLSGAMPPVIGYCSVLNFNYESLILMLIFIIWQIPHSYSLSIIHVDDYKKANIPVLPLYYGCLITKKYIIIFIILYILLIFLLSVITNNSLYFIIINIPVMITWLYTSLINHNIYIWAKKIFILSIININVFNLSILSFYKI
ncbi:MAG: heme o synthase [Candidatus Lightella neohaematopini]|nr:heme o synthase [Candidatus Lightella neohaematopini]